MAGMIVRILPVASLCAALLFAAGCATSDDPADENGEDGGDTAEDASAGDGDEAVGRSAETPDSTAAAPGRPTASTRVIPAGSYSWCPAWATMIAAADAYQDAAARASVAVDQIGLALNPAGEGDLVADREAAAAALIEYQTASADAAAAAEAVYAAAADAADAAHAAHTEAYTAMAAARWAGDEQAWQAAEPVFAAAHAALTVALEASSDPEMMGDLTIGTSGWETGVYVDWHPEWPNGLRRSQADQIGGLCT